MNPRRRRHNRIARRRRKARAGWRPSIWTAIVRKMLLDRILFGVSVVEITPNGPRHVPAIGMKYERCPQ